MKLYMYPVSTTAKVYETFNGFCASTKGQPWQAIT